MKNRRVTGALVGTVLAVFTVMLLESIHEAPVSPYIAYLTGMTFAVFGALVVGVQKRFNPFSWYEN
jgi:hypothetical protein